MKLSSQFTLLLLLALGAHVACAQTTKPHAAQTNTGKSQLAIDAASKQGKFLFLVVTKGDSPAYRTMLGVAEKGVALRAETSLMSTIDAGDASEQSVLERLGVLRAPMPVTVAVAPNGAVTGIFPRTLQDSQLTAAIVPPTMMCCMKILQEQKLVFVCLTRDETTPATIPQGVQQVQQHPDFRNRIATVSMYVNDPAEARLLAQMQIQPEKASVPQAVLIAPPGVLVGHFGAKATRDEILAAIHKSGQCCDDPNCKHNQSSSTAPTAQSTTPKRK